MNHGIASSGVAYVRRGWVAIQLHDVTAGACSCGSTDPEHIRKQGGKHPVYGGWQVDGSPGQLRTEADVAQAWAARPGANIGLVTGAASGFWVLDVDPDNGGHVVLAGLVAAFGPLPETYTVTTGSGGAHYYWRLPDWEPGGSRGRLPVGLDVRGRGGQVVAPPSVSSKGGYAVAVDVPIADAPAWLLDMIRPVEGLPAARMENWSGAGQGGAGGAPVAGDRGVVYARAAVVAELAELQAAPVGARNETAFKVACRLAELVNAGWSGLGDGLDVAAAFLATCERLNVDGTFPSGEANAVLNKGIAHVHGAAAVLPAGDYGTRIELATLPPGVADFSPAGQGPAHDPLLPWVEAEAQRQVIRERAKALVAERAELAARPNYLARMVSSKALAARPRPTPLVADWLDSNTLARVYGASNHGKSHVALDMAACVSLGIPWHGHATTAARTVYVLAEAADGMGRRVAAWEERHERECSIVFLPEPVQVLGTGWRWFVQDMITLRAGFVVFDTQAKVTLGVNENDNTALGLAMARLDDLRVATGACVLLVHHKGANGLVRGGTAGTGAMDDEIDVTRIGTSIKVRSGKVRDRAAPAGLELELTPFGDSVVLVADGEPRGVLGPFRAPGLAGAGSGARRAQQFASRVLALVDVLVRNYSEGNGGTESDIRALYYLHPEMIELSVGARKEAFRRSWNRLEELGRIARVRGMSRYKFVEVDELGPLDANPDKVAPEGWLLAEASLSRKKQSD